MRRALHTAIAAGLVVLVGGSWAPASAQLVFEAVGERALGMGGAFVAVADDATAVHWNPAGLVAGQPAGATIGWHRFGVGKADALPSPGQSRGQSSLTSLGTWPLGFSYGSENRQWIVPTGDGLGGNTLRVSHFGVTVLQTIVSNVVVGSTLKLMRGRFATTGIGEATSGAAFDRLRETEGDGQTAFDLDVGVMALGRVVSVGLVSKNLRSPEFRESAESATSLPRQTRAGISVRARDGLTLALDVDLNTVDLMGDSRQMLAAGGEIRLGPRFRVRTGARANLARSGHLVGAVGASVAVRTGLWVDGHYSRGRESGSREFGVALRAGY